MSYYAVIMAGGGGTRLWPLSRKASPKQVIKLFGEQSLYQIAVARLQGVIAPEDIRVVTTRDLFADLQQSTPFMNAEQFLLEPQPRGTASVVGLAAAVLSLQDPQAMMAIMTADHIIQNVSLFQQLLREAQAVAQQGYLVTMGILPTEPATGFGYIETGERLPDQTDIRAHRVIRFVEKPNLETAQHMLAAGNYYWNSGMFFWRVDVILEQFRQFMPDLYERLMRIRDAWQTPQRDEEIASLWPDIVPQTVDYGIMEKAERVAVLPAEGMGWHDVGSWNSLNEVIHADENDNILLGDQIIDLDTRASIVYEKDSTKVVATLGLQDMIVIDTEEALLVCRREDSQRIKEIIQAINNRHMEKYL